MLLASIAFAIPATAFAASNANASAASPSMFDHIVVLILENHSLNEIYGSSSAPYLTGLANAWSLSQGYSAVDHPSEPNYLALVSGLAGDCSNSS
ncbi:hypothetical protein E6H14_03600, partial [Candidatus Bathyarchaeota archaeon]